jgi:glutathione S-transferase
VMLTLEVKKLPYQSSVLEFSKQQHKAPAYLELNPRGKVPTLKDGDFVIYESIAIMAYLDRKYPEPPIFGRTAEEAGAIWQTVCEAESYLAPAGDKIIRPMFFGKGLDQIEQIQEAAESVRRELKSIDTRLQQSPWLVNGQISAADIAVFPLIQLLLRAASKEAAAPFHLGLIPLSGAYPNIAKWVSRIEALSGYDRTYPPHWR